MCRYASTKSLAKPTNYITKRPNYLQGTGMKLRIIFEYLPGLK